MAAGAMEFDPMSGRSRIIGGKVRSDYQQKCFYVFRMVCSKHGELIGNWVFWPIDPCCNKAKCFGPFDCSSLDPVLPKKVKAKK